MRILKILRERAQARAARPTFNSTVLVDYKHVALFSVYSHRYITLMNALGMPMCVDKLPAGERKLLKNGLFCFGYALNNQVWFRSVLNDQYLRDGMFWIPGLRFDGNSLGFSELFDISFVARNHFTLTSNNLGGGTVRVMGDDDLYLDCNGSPQDVRCVFELLERVDVAGLAVGATLGLMRYCVVEITSLDVDAASGAVTAVRAKRAGEDFKSAARLVTWVSNSPHEIQVDAWEYDYILDDKADDDDAAEDDEGAAAAAATSGSDWRKHINRNSAACTVLVANAALRVAQKGQVVQLERRGLYIVDRPCVRDGERMRLIKIPDGKKKDMSVLAGALEHR